MADKSPQVVARFVLDADGKPQAIQDKDAQGHDRKHYQIVLGVEDAPSDTYAVNYRLHDSYFNPIRESTDRTSGFAEALTSYGDYTLLAKIRSMNGTQTVAVDLSRALQQGHAQASPEIQAAIADIAEH